MNNVGLKFMCLSAGVPAQDAQCFQPGYWCIKRYGRRSDRNELTRAGARPFKRPGVLDWRNDHRFKNAMLLPYMRRSSTIDGRFPRLCLAGVVCEHRSEQVRSMQGAGAERRVRSSLIQAIL